jgi:hypothetical protein
MKQLLPVIIIVVVASIAAVGVVGSVFYMRPDLLGVVPPATPADSAATAHAAVDSVNGPHMPPDVSGEGGDSTHVAEVMNVSPPDTLLGVLTAALMRSDSLTERLRTAMDSTRVSRAAADSVHGAQRAAMAKVLEAMDPVSAARILADFPDGDVKQIIFTIKRKQAAKILAALQPDRVARIMR